MDIPHINGDSNAPKGLRRALAIIGQTAKKYAKMRRSGFSRQPRQVCKVCATMFDFAIVDPKATVQASLCSDCKQKLAEGYTACVTTNPDAFAFVRHPHLKATGQAGKIIQMSAENFAMIRKKFEEYESKTPPASEA